MSWMLKARGAYDNCILPEDEESPVSKKSCCQCFLCVVKLHSANVSWVLFSFKIPVFPTITIQS